MRASLLAPLNLWRPIWFACCAWRCSVRPELSWLVEVCYESSADIAVEDTDRQLLEQSHSKHLVCLPSWVTISSLEFAEHAAGSLLHLQFQLNAEPRQHPVLRGPGAG